MVDDEGSMRELLDIMLTAEGYDVTLASGGQEACDFLENNRYDLIVTDIRMKDLDGIGVLKKAKALILMLWLSSYQLLQQQRLLLRP